MDDRMSQALDLALELINRNNWIKDRYTLLSARRVCRTWRTSLVFSGRITAVTLQDMNDVLLARLFIILSRPYPRRPWRTFEESCPFPNLTTLKVGDPLSLELGKCESSLQLLASLGKNVVFDMKVDSSFSDQVVALMNLARFSYPSRLSWVGNLSVLAANIDAFTNLTWLTLSKVPTSMDSSVSMNMLSQLKSLRTLQLPMDRSDWAHVQCHNFTQLNRLECTDGCFHWGVKEMGNVMDGVFGIFEWEEFFPEIMDLQSGIMDSWCWLYATVSGGSLRMARCECLIRLCVADSDCDPTFHTLAGVLKYGRYAAHLAIEMHEASDDRFTVNLLYGEHLNDPGYFITYEHSTTSLEPLGYNQHQPGTIVDNITPDSDSTTPVLITKRGVQTKASLFDVTMSGCSLINLNRLAEQLPDLFPEIDTLKIRARSSMCPFKSYLGCFPRVTTLRVKVDKNKYSH